MAAAIRLITILLAFCAALVIGKAGYGPGEQDWGYVDVRPGAHMFYWLYYTTANVSSYTERPLALWLQGGPGGSSTGKGNFEELGPLDIDGNSRSWTWVKDMNVLFIDNPVGAGFSYVDNESHITTTNKEIALDLVELMKRFYALHPEFETVPLHIFSQSYGGKMAPEFALELHYAKERSEIRSNLVSVALGNPWTSPIDSVLSWGPLLLHMGIVDHDGYDEIMKLANYTAQLVADERWEEATGLYGNTLSLIGGLSEDVDFYNVLTKINMSPNERTYQNSVRSQMNINTLMRGSVAKALGIPSHVKWTGMHWATFHSQSAEFMKPVIHIVNELLDKTPIKVGVYSGNLDLICATAGNVNWIEKLSWTRRNEYLNATRTPIWVDGIVEGYQKTGGNFSMYWINRAGHSSPAENPAAMSHVLGEFTGFGYSV